MWAFKKLSIIVLIAYIGEALATLADEVASPSPSEVAISANKAPKSKPSVIDINASGEFAPPTKSEATGTTLKPSPPDPTTLNSVSESPAQVVLTPPSLEPDLKPITPPSEESASQPPLDAIGTSPSSSSSGTEGIKDSLVSTPLPVTETAARAFQAATPAPDDAEGKVTPPPKPKATKLVLPPPAKQPLPSAVPIPRPAQRPTKPKPTPVPKDGTGFKLDNPMPQAVEKIPKKIKPAPSQKIKATIPALTAEEDQSDTGNKSPVIEKVTVSPPSSEVRSDENINDYDYKTTEEPNNAGGEVDASDSQPKLGQNENIEQVQQTSINKGSIIRSEKIMKVGQRFEMRSKLEVVQNSKSTSDKNSAKKDEKGANAKSQKSEKQNAQKGETENEKMKESKTKSSMRLKEIQSIEGTKIKSKRLEPIKPLKSLETIQPIQQMDAMEG